mmetsp:Transcript_27908/g.61239  ORF Transcript_27908/g.61239 Transcript_27908/m.61239 type:complete len:143 (+) Transcript_27908:771-1199(+)
MRHMPWYCCLLGHLRMVLWKRAPDVVRTGFETSHRSPSMLAPLCAAATAAAAAAAGQPLSASSLGDEYEAMCGVCLDARDFVGMAPCGHKMCGGCASELLRLHPSGPAPCPFCRAAICGFSAVSQQLTPASQQHTPAPERVV